MDAIDVWALMRTISESFCVAVGFGVFGFVRWLANVRPSGLSRGWPRSSCGVVADAVAAASSEEARPSSLLCLSMPSCWCYLSVGLFFSSVGRNSGVAEGFGHFG